MPIRWRGPEEDKLFQNQLMASPRDGRPNHTRGRAERRRVMESTPVDEDSGGNGASPGFAADVHELAAAEHDSSGVAASGKRKRQAGAAEGFDEQQVRDGDQQEAANAAKSTAAPSQVPSPCAPDDLTCPRAPSILCGRCSCAS